ncbi:hypothetical protein [Halopiger goleimassiliensis]|uniref:hypothetical protein n=1 Tax=Halopiger goleimassiliensis TaxID=1293048 RepID=UPI000677D9E8|nr:hypothetical protein [Halopiger goleimassiliensis]
MTGHQRQDSSSAIRRWNRVFEVLAVDPRRQLVDALMDVPDGGAVQLPDAAANPDLERDPDRLRLELRHQHLPMLADADYVEWQHRPFSASRGPQFAELEAVMCGLYATADDLPDRLVRGCHPFEREFDGSEW